MAFEKLRTIVTAAIPHYHLEARSLSRFANPEFEAGLLGEMLERASRTRRLWELSGGRGLNREPGR
jgi:hypothetical protein